MSVALRLALPFWGGMVWLLIASIPYITDSGSTNIKKVLCSIGWIIVSLLISFVEFYCFFVRLLEIL